MTIKSSNTRGLTIIEVIVAVAILLVMILGVTTGFSAYADRQAFNQFVNEVELSLREQRQRTVASLDDAQYGVYIGTTSIEYYEGLSYPAAAAIEIQAMPAAYTATSSFSDANWYITYARLTGAASATGTITIDDTKTGKTATITINALGLIE